MLPVVLDCIITFLHGDGSVDDFPPLLGDQPVFNFENHRLQTLGIGPHYLVKFRELGEGKETISGKKSSWRKNGFRKKKRIDKVA